MTTFGPTYSHEEIASFSLKSHLFDDEGFFRAENEWAQSEVGEGVAEVWERAVSTDKTPNERACLIRSGTRLDGSSPLKIGAADQISNLA